MQIIYIILAALGLGFLVFIHELAHYWMARRVGMRVEAFSIGFGKAIIHWKKDGVLWKIGWLPFGGYVKIAGQQVPKGVDPEKVPGGYFSKKPIDRIKVAGIAPIVNIIFAFILFSAIWFLGGRFKPYQEYSNRIGYVDPQSEIYRKDGIGPGDEIQKFNHQNFHSFKDVMQGAIISSKGVQVSGLKYNYLKGTSSPYNVSVCPYELPNAMMKDFLTSGILAPASYLIYDRYNETIENEIKNNSPMHNSGISYGDRIIWMDGELIFSNMQLSSLLNSDYTLVTLIRNNKIELARISKVHINELKMSADYRSELGDYRFDNNMKGSLNSFYTLPYLLDDKLTVQSNLFFLDKDVQERALVKPTSANLTLSSLQIGDKILAVDGSPISNPSALFNALQSKQSNIIVQSGNANLPKVPYETANKGYEASIDFNELNQMMHSIGTSSSEKTVGKLKLLNPILPTSLKALVQSSDSQAMKDNLMLYKMKIDQITDEEKKAEALKLFEKEQNRLVLGISLQDRQIIYNPPPYVTFVNVSQEMGKTLKGLVTGSLNPKWLSGPIGIVQVMHQGWSLGFKEALYWLGLISLNLGFLNLLPIPVLDGGHICFAMWEIVTRKPLKQKTMEKIIIPFYILMVGLFLFVTFHDLSRLVKGIF